ncbi:Transmembrane_domain-containing protein [Hexamita inflata]|uniref:Transmembrane_domain-containing protein n=1 Tax=Hexamita inflata TaxID=28002 RepID=A0ABP1HX16_9EUKA
MTIDKCLKTDCSKFICSIFPSCYKKSRYDPDLLFAFRIIFVILAVLNVILFFMYALVKPKNKTITSNLKIFAVSFVALMCRIFWTLFSRYYYYDNVPVQTEQVLNAVSLTLIYLQQSFYVQSWLQLILKLNQMKGENFVKYTFPIVDIVVSLTALVVIILRCVNTDKQLYQIFCKIVAIANLVLTAIYSIVGGLILFKLKGYYQFCSKTVQSFTLVSIILIFITVTRFVALIWQDINNEYLEQNLFGLLEYFVPDFLSTLVINFMQLQIYFSTRKQIKTDEQRNLIDGSSEAYV